MAIKDLLDRFRKGLSKTAKLFDFTSWFGRKVDQSILDSLEANGRFERQTGGHNG